MFCPWQYRLFWGNGNKNNVDAFRNEEFGKEEEWEVSEESEEGNKEELKKEEEEKEEKDRNHSINKTVKSILI